MEVCFACFYVWLFFFLRFFSGFHVQSLETIVSFVISFEYIQIECIIATLS